MLTNETQINDFLDMFFAIRDQLPTIQKVQEHIAIDDWAAPLNDNVLETFYFRDAYTKYCFPLLTHELLTGLTEFLAWRPVIELACGTGWLAYWLKRYGANLVRAVDTKEWGFKEYLPIVEKGDAAQAIRKDVRHYILSWPVYESDIAYQVWQNLAEGDILIMIGEGEGGCTADGQFFEAVGEELDHRIPHVAFWGIHDRVQIYRR